MHLTRLELMDLHRDALFLRDADGRLRSVNEEPWPAAPRFWMGRTPDGNRWSLRYDLPVDLAAQLEQLLQSEPVAAELEPAPRMREPIMALLRQHAPVSNEYRGPAYWIPDLPMPQGNAVIVTRENVDVLANRSAWLAECASDPACGPVAAVLDGGYAVAHCYCARITPLACEAGVETDLAYRGRGYAGHAVAVWADSVRRSGRLPLYGTWWQNLASQAVARKLSMVQYGEDWSVD